MAWSMRGKKTNGVKHEKKIGDVTYNVLMRLGHALKQNQSCFLREHQPKRTIVSDDLRFTDH
jgi:hypothetical protein